MLSAAPDLVPVKVSDNSQIFHKYFTNISAISQVFQLLHRYRRYFSGFFRYFSAGIKVFDNFWFPHNFIWIQYQYIECWEYCCCYYVTIIPELCQHCPKPQLPTARNSFPQERLFLQNCNLTTNFSLRKIQNWTRRALLAQLKAAALHRNYKKNRP